MARHDWSEWVGELEVRGFSRVRCDIKTHCRVLDGEGAPIKGRTCDVSGGGLQFRFPADHGVKPGQRIEMYFRNESDEMDLTLPGVVVWRRWNDATHDLSVGVQFPQLSPALREALLAILRNDEGDEELEESDPQFLRLKRYLSARLKHAGWLFTKGEFGLVRDIGLGGMGVEAEKRWRANSVCAARIFIETAAEPVDILARVVRSSKDRAKKRWFMGMRFEAMDEESLRALRRFLSDEIRRAILG